MKSAAENGKIRGVKDVVAWTRKKVYTILKTEEGVDDMSYASVFTNGGSQAVRIPAAFRFATDRVSVEAVDGGILLRPVAPKKKSFFEFLRSAQLEEGELDLTRDRDVGRTVEL